MDLQFYQGLLDNMFDGVYFVDRTRKITYWNAGAERISGYSAAETVGNRCSNNLLRHVDEEGHQLCLEGCPLKAVMSDGQVREAEVYMHHKDGERVPVVVRAAPIRDDGGEIVGAVEVFVPGRAAARAEEMIEELKQEAMHDPLTGLGNRRYGQANLGSILSASEERGRDAGLLFVDIDSFKKVNDTYGHAAGDEVLRMVGKTLLNSLSRGEMVARWGGEEFVVLLPNADSATVQATAERLRMLVEHSWCQVVDQTIQVTISVGAVAIRSGDTEDSVLERADALLYSSKQNGRNLVTSG